MKKVGTALRNIFSKSLNLRLRGYFTLEAALVFPIVLGCLTMLIFLLMFLNGRTIMSSTAYASAIRMSSCNKEEIADYISNYDGFGYSRKMMIGSWSGSSDMQDNDREIVADIRANFKIYMPYIFTKDSMGNSCYIRGIGVKNKAVKIIRMTRLVEDIADAIKINNEG